MSGSIFPRLLRRNFLRHRPPSPYFHPTTTSSLNLNYKTVLSRLNGIGQRGFATPHPLPRRGVKWELVMAPPLWMPCLLPARRHTKRGPWHWTGWPRNPGGRQDGYLWHYRFKGRVNFSPGKVWKVSYQPEDKEKRTSACSPSFR